jgi:polysaccharide pyruvyl transferase WcaK-like protein
LTDGTLKLVLILAGDCDGNLGDKAIVRSTCDELHRLNPGVSIFIKSNLSPAHCAAYFRATPIPKGPRSIMQTLQTASRADLVLVGGGGLFQDDDSLVKMPYWGIKVAIVRLFAHRMVTYSMGAGPLHSRLGRIFARLAMLCMQRVSVRDHTGQATLAPLTSKPVIVVPDPALLLHKPAGATLTPALQTAVEQARGPLIAIALREWFHQTSTFIPHKYAVRYKLRKVPGQAQRAVFYPLMAQALDDIVRQSGATLLFLPSYNVGHEGDHECCERVMAAMQTRSSHLILLDDPVDYLVLGSHLSLIISARLHPVILCTSVGVPAIGLSYNPKFAGYFEKLGQQDRLFSLSDFQTGASRDQLVSQALATLAAPPDLSAAIEKQKQCLLEFNKEVMRAD